MTSCIRCLSGKKRWKVPFGSCRIMIRRTFVNSWPKLLVLEYMYLVRLYNYQGVWESIELLLGIYKVFSLEELDSCVRDTHTITIIALYNHAAGNHVAGNHIEINTWLDIKRENGSTTWASPAQLGQSLAKSTTKVFSQTLTLNHLTLAQIWT